MQFNSLHCSGNYKVGDFINAGFNQEGEKNFFLAVLNWLGARGSMVPSPPLSSLALSFPSLSSLSLTSRPLTTS